MTPANRTAPRKWYYSARFLGFMAVIFVLAVIITRNIYEPLVGMLIFWGTLVIPAVAQHFWQKFKRGEAEARQSPDNSRR